MDYNPYTARLFEVARKLSEAGESKQRLEGDIQWQSEFDPSLAHFDLATLEGQLLELRRCISEVEGENAQLTPRIEAARMIARAGFNPAYWLSSRRSDGKAELRELIAASDRMIGRQIVLLESSKGVLLKQVELERNLARYAGFDYEVAQTDLQEVSRNFSTLDAQVEKLRASKDKVDADLAPVLTELNRYEGRKRELLGEIAQAERLDKRMNEAQSGYDKRGVHEACRELFNESSPRRVLDARRNLLRKEEDKIAKCDRRARDVALRASRVVRTLIMDGNNLCYEFHQFIGLAPLKAAAIALSANYKVIIVFDAGIRSLLQKGDSEIAQQFRDMAKVHIVGSKHTADETILDAAVDRTTYVVSNDRFAEFNDKAAVRENRVFTHDILNGRVLIRDLSIDEAYEQATRV